MSVSADYTDGDPTALRRRLRANGYRPVPVAGKAVLLPNWSSVCSNADDDEMQRWPTTFTYDDRGKTKTYRGDRHTNTGILCGLMVGLDIDIIVPDLAQQIDRLAESLLGATSLLRIGMAPKLLRCYRAETPMRKIETSELFLPDGTKVQVEAMGAGQQVVGFGIHPDTHRPYTWPKSSPLDVPMMALPVVSEQSLRAFMAAAEAVLRQAGGRTKKEMETAAKGTSNENEPRASSARAKDAGGHTFFRRVNNAALANLSRWVPRLFPKAELQANTRAYRIRSADLGRDYEEDLSIHPGGVHDFGPRQRLTPCDVVMEFGGAPSVTAAALTLCDWLGCDPAEFGWTLNQSKPKGAKAANGEAAPEAPRPPDTSSDPVAELVAEFNARFFVLNENGRAILYAPRHDPILNRRFFERITFGDFSKLFSNRIVQIGFTKKGRPIMRPCATVWLNHPDRRQYIGGVTFDPSRRAQPKDILNLWRGFAVEPREGNWDELRRHILGVICNFDNRLFEYLLDWMADLVQNPAKQGEVAIVLRGPEGSGKGVLARAIKYLFGQHGLAISNPKHLVGNFNAHLRDTVFLFADEAFYAGDKQHVGVLKALITEPYLTIEGKYQNAAQMPNFLHVMMASNEDWVVPASLDSRRWVVIDVPGHKVGAHSYFAAIQKQLEGGGYAALLHDLLRRDLARNNLRDIPMTEALQTQRKMSLDTTHAWWLHCLHRGYVFQSRLGLEDHFGQWHEFLPTEVLFASYERYCTERRERHPLPRELFGKWMTGMGAKPSRRRNHAIGEHMVDAMTDGRSGRIAELIMSALPHGYLLGGLEAAREAFSAETGLTIDWGSEAP